MNNINGTNLFIGNQFSAVSQDIYKFDIKYILNMSPVYLPIDTNQIKAYKQIKWEDVPEQNIYNDLKDGFLFLDSALIKKENVLICCQAGKSRSATMLIAYIMKVYNLSFEDAYNLVRKNRQIDPNQGFINQLKKLQNNQL